MKKTLATFAVLCVCGAAFAAGTASYAVVPYVAPGTDVAYPIAQYEGEGHRVYDLQVNVDAGDKWTTASALAYFMSDAPGGSLAFWDHPSGGNIPAPSNFSYFGLAAYDSFWTCTEEYPNPDLAPTAVATTFAPGSPIQNTATVREAEWYADPGDPEAGAGTFTLARYNVWGELPEGTYAEPVGPEAAWLVIEGDYYYASTGGTPHPYSLSIPVAWFPEPASLSLLALGGLALLRRR